MDSRRTAQRPARVLSADSPLLGGPLPAEAGAEDRAPTRAGLRRERRPLPAARAARPSRLRDLRDLRSLLPAPDPERQVDDWGRSERVFQMIEPLLNFYYRYWFRVEVEGIEHVPADGGALLVSNHSGALPPDAPMIMQAIRNEHPSPRPLYMMGENWFKGYPGVGMLATKIGLVSAHPANAHRLLHDEGKLALVFPEGQKGTRKVYWQRYKLRRFGRGGFVKTAIRAGVPIVPDRRRRRRGGDADLRPREAARAAHRADLLSRQPRLPPLRPARRADVPAGEVPHPLPRAGPLRAPGPDAADDVAFVQQAADDVRARIQARSNEMLRERKSVWFG